MSSPLVRIIERVAVHLHRKDKLDLYSLTSKYQRDYERRKRVWPELKWRIWERDNFTCVYCGVRKFLTSDHVVPVAEGGKTTYENLVTACNTCNNRKGHIPHEEFIRSKWLKKKKKRVRRGLIMKAKRTKMNQQLDGPTQT